jgi:hypothetical protein
LVNYFDANELNVKKFEENEIDVIDNFETIIVTTMNDVNEYNK